MNTASLTQAVPILARTVVVDPLLLAHLDSSRVIDAFCHVFSMGAHWKMHALWQVLLPKHPLLTGSVFTPSSWLSTDSPARLRKFFEQYMEENAALSPALASLSPSQSWLVEQAGIYPAPPTVIYRNLHIFTLSQCNRGMLDQLAILRAVLGSLEEIDVTVLSPSSFPRSESNAALLETLMDLPEDVQIRHLNLAETSLELDLRRWWLSPHGTRPQVILQMPLPAHSLEPPNPPPPSEAKSQPMSPVVGCTSLQRSTQKRNQIEIVCDIYQPIMDPQVSFPAFVDALQLVRGSRRTRAHPCFANTAASEPIVLDLVAVVHDFSTALLHGTAALLRPSTSTTSCWDNAFERDDERENNEDIQGSSSQLGPAFTPTAPSPEYFVALHNIMAKSKSADATAQPSTCIFRQTRHGVSGYFALVPELSAHATSPAFWLMGIAGKDLVGTQVELATANQSHSTEGDGHEGTDETEEEETTHASTVEAAMGQVIEMNTSRHAKRVYTTTIFCLCSYSYERCVYAEE